MLPYGRAEEPKASVEEDVYGGIIFQLEVFSVPKQTAADLLFDKPIPSEFEPIRRQLHEMVRQKKAELVAIPAISCLAGDRVVSESILEVRYPTEFEPPEILKDFSATTTPATQPPVFPSNPTTPTAFETRNTGVSFEISPQVDADSLRITAEFVLTMTALQKMVSYPSSEAGKGLVQVPYFYTKKIQTKVALPANGSMLVGSLTPDPTLSKPDDPRIELVFLRGTFQKVGTLKPDKPSKPAAPPPP